MKAMILAAGRGERLRPLTDSIPKPLVRVGEQTLIDTHLQSLAQSGIEEVIINTAWLSEQIVQHLGDGAQHGVRISYSHEPSGALDSGGGIHKALPLLGTAPFLVINADILTDFPFSSLSLPTGMLAHLVLVENPDWHPDGDFQLSNGQITCRESPCLTFSGIAVYHPDLFVHCHAGRFSVVPLLELAMHNGQLSGELWTGRWHDTGTHERLRVARDDSGLRSE